MPSFPRCVLTQNTPRRVASQASRSLTLVVLAAVAGLAIPLTAAAQKPTNLNTFESRFYQVHTSLDRQKVKPIAHRMDVIFHHYRERFSNFDRRSHQPISLYLFRTRDQYRRFLKKRDVEASGSGGLFFVLPRHQLRGLATWVSGRPQQRIAEVLQHEGFHQFVYFFIGPNIPQWVNEGLAQYFEDARIRGENIKLGDPNPRRVRFLEQAYRQNKLMPMEKILTLSMKQWNRRLNKSPLASKRIYAQSWSMVYFLIHGRDGRYRDAFRDYLHQLAAGKSSEQAARAAFEVDTFRPMSRQWLSFLKRRFFN